MSDVNATKYELCWLDSAYVMLDQSKYMPRQSKAHTSQRLRALYQLRQRRASELLREQELSPRTRPSASRSQPMKVCTNPDRRIVLLREHLVLTSEQPNRAPCVPPNLGVPKYCEHPIHKGLREDVAAREERFRYLLDGRFQLTCSRNYDESTYPSPREDRSPACGSRNCW